ncbi:MAG TPA: M4 family metallopeptidase [Myxococcales bacterium]|nr:M4 family metallopeptidase [Myxococcales bacterium]
MTPHRHSIFCILPPHLLEHVATNAKTPAQRHRALSTLATDSTHRAMRAVRAASFVSGAPKQPRLHAFEGKVRRTIWTARSERALPGAAVARTEGSKPTGDAAVDEAYDGLGATFDYYWHVHCRSSIDDEGMALDATVHFGREYDNAFWNGERMVFGDGDGELFNRFTACVDVIGHELSHGVIEDEAQLQYFNQSGALNESCADVFGTLVRQRLLNQAVDRADWLIGAGLFTSGVKGAALRSLKAPGTAYDDPALGKDPQPDHMSKYVHTLDDNGGVHINSGIPNRAFYLVATALGGHAWEKAGRIWYETLRDSRLRPNASFCRFAGRTVANAARLFGSNGDVEQAVRAAWETVGVSTK